MNCALNYAWFSLICAIIFLFLLFYLFSLVSILEYSEKGIQVPCILLNTTTTTTTTPTALTTTTMTSPTTNNHHNFSKSDSGSDNEVGIQITSACLHINQSIRLSYSTAAVTALSFYPVAGNN